MSFACKPCLHSVVRSSFFLTVFINNEITELSCKSKLTGLRFYYYALAAEDILFLFQTISMMLSDNRQQQQISSSFKHLPSARISCSVFHFSTPFFLPHLIAHTRHPSPKNALLKGRTGPQRYTPKGSKWQEAAGWKWRSWHCASIARVGPSSGVSSAFRVFDGPQQPKKPRELSSCTEDLYKRYLEYVSTTPIQRQFYSLFWCLQHFITPSSGHWSYILVPETTREDALRV
jgi:hypothetical protein